MTHAADFFRSAVAACETLGARGLLLTQYPEAVPTDLPATVRHCPFAPFRQLLPRCSAVVHHGGVGTTAAALEAGCPQLVLPLAWDQPDNASRIVKLGAGLTLPPRQRTTTHLARTLSRLTTPDLRARCRTLATRAAQSDGFNVAAGWLEDLTPRVSTPKQSHAPRL